MSKLKTYLGLLGSAVLMSTSSVVVATEHREVPAAPIKGKVTVDSVVLEKSITDAVDFLLGHQNKDGSWGNARKTKEINIYAPLPGAHHAYRAGSTMLALEGMIASRDQRPEVKEAIARCEKWMFEKLPKLRRAEQTTTYNVWGHAYAIRSVVALSRREGVTELQKAKYKAFAEEQIKLLEKYQCLDGGWGYLNMRVFLSQKPAGDGTSFTTATVINAMLDAKDEFGIELNSMMIKRARNEIKRQEVPGFNYVYSHQHRKAPVYPINRKAGSLARTQVCITALKRLGDKRITEELQVRTLDDLVKRNGWLDIARKRPKPHDIHFSISGYFYYYGHYYASENLSLLPKEKQTEWKHKLARIMIDHQDRDGSWWDYPLYNYHQAYGTGYGLTIMSRLRVDQKSN